MHSSTSGCGCGCAVAGGATACLNPWWVLLTQTCEPPQAGTRAVGQAVLPAGAWRECRAPLSAGLTPASQEDQGWPCHKKAPYHQAPAHKHPAGSRAATQTQRCSQWQGQPTWLLRSSSQVSSAPTNAWRGSSLCTHTLWRQATHPRCQSSAPHAEAGCSSSVACRQQWLISDKGLVRGQQQLGRWRHGAGPTQALQAGLLLVADVSLHLTARGAALQTLQYAPTGNSSASR